VRFDGPVPSEPEVASAPARRSTRGRRALRAAVAVVAAAALLALAGLPVYVFPRVDRPVHADAVIVIGPSSPDRISLGRQLVRDGYAPRLFVSEPSDKLSYRPCHDGDATCFSPEPSTTRGEAAFVRAQARAHGWSRVIVVTGQFHVSRTRYIFGRCSGVAPEIVAAHESLGPGDWAWQYLYQTAGFVKAAVVGCATG
jgi:uncharacterized SAM-binding protein YcdF (DUF218 family)